MSKSNKNRKYVSDGASFNNLDEIGAKLTGTISTHSHNVAQINTNSNNRFVTDVEKDNLDKKLGESEEEVISFVLNELNNRINNLENI